MINKRRRMHGKTDYKARLNLLKTDKPRIVIRKTNRYVIAQYIESKEAQDKIIFGANSNELLKYGWPESAKGSLKSIPASYLTGFLLGRKILFKFDNPKAVIDFGLNRNVKKSRLYAALKGVIDAGIEMNAEDVFPDEKIIEGKVIKNKVDIKKIKEKIENETE
jgi:large subunit ribosomal protein L18